VGELGQKRRRLREQRRVREGLLLDLGALVYELHRQGKRAPELLQQKAAELTVIDDEVRELEEALDDPHAREPQPAGPDAADPATEEVDAAELEAPLADDEIAEDLADEDLPEDELDDRELTDDEPALARHEHEEPRA
jgi:hypothetical protein